MNQFISVNILIMNFVICFFSNLTNAWIRCLDDYWWLMCLIWPHVQMNLCFGQHEGIQDDGLSEVFWWCFIGFMFQWTEHISASHVKVQGWRTSWRLRKKINCTLLSATVAAPTILLYPNRYTCRFINFPLMSTVGTHFLNPLLLAETVIVCVCVQYVAVVVTFQLFRTSVTIREQPDVPEILKVQMIDLSTRISQRPGAQAFRWASSSCGHLSQVWALCGFCVVWWTWLNDSSCVNEWSICGPAGWRRRCSTGTLQVYSSRGRYLHSSPQWETPLPLCLASCSS